MTIQVHCDGSSTGRSGREGGWAYVIEQDGKVLYAGKGGHPETTNNLMEMEGAIQGLRALEKVGPKHWRNKEAVILVSDSKYCLGMATGKLAAATNLEKVAELQALYKRICTDSRWVHGHTGDKYNERCDSLAKIGKQEALLSVLKGR